MTISELVKEAHENAKNKGFWEGDSHNIPEKLALIHSEVSEALEEIRKGQPPTTIWWSSYEKPEGFRFELADAVIRIADLCGHLGIDLECAIEIKHAFNKTRPPKHGKKF